MMMIMKAEKKWYEKLDHICVGRHDECAFFEKSDGKYYCTKRTHANRVHPVQCPWIRTERPNDIRTNYIPHRCPDSMYNDCVHRSNKYFCSHTEHGGKEPHAPCPNYISKNVRKSNPNDYVKFRVDWNERARNNSGNGYIGWAELCERTARESSGVLCWHERCHDQTERAVVLCSDRKSVV